MAFRAGRETRDRTLASAAHPQITHNRPAKTSGGCHFSEIGLDIARRSGIINAGGGHAALSRTSWPQRPRKDDNLHLCPEQRSSRRPKPGMGCRPVHTVCVNLDPRLA